MNNYLSERELDLLLSFPRASFESIFPELRLVSMDWTDRLDSLYFYIDGEISEDDYESISLMETYFQPAFRKTAWGELEIIDMPYPKPINHPGVCVYARKETPSIGKTDRGVIIQKMDRRSKVMLALQRAMVGLVFPQIREIGASWDDESAIIHVIVDGELSRENVKDLELMYAYFWAQFPVDEMRKSDLKIQRNDFPNLLKNTGCDAAIYIRKEYPCL